MRAAPATDRDLRLDFFRGIALWLIFVDHIPSNIVNSFTLRNFGFSDAAEAFVFISGYTAAFVYARAMRERGFFTASGRILRRVWQLYVAHIFLFVIFFAQIAYVARTFQNPLFAEEMNIVELLREPDVMFPQAMLLGSTRPTWTSCRSISCCCWLFRLCCGCCCARRRSRCWFRS